MPNTGDTNSANIIKRINENSRLIEEHTKKDEKLFEKVMKHLSDISKEQCVQRSNHLEHLEKYARETSTAVKELHDKMDKNTQATIKNTTDIGWLRWAVMAVGGAVIAGTVGLIFTR